MKEGKMVIMTADNSTEKEMREFLQQRIEGAVVALIKLEQEEGIPVDGVSIHITGAGMTNGNFLIDLVITPDDNSLISGINGFNENLNDIN